jgi:uncharacterized heparinase superfamily protein
VRNQSPRAALLLRTVTHLKPSQLAHRVRLRGQRALIARFPVRAGRLLARNVGSTVGWPEVSPIDAAVADGYPSADANAAGEFRFLEETRSLGTPPDWEQREASQLWRYHLHYFEWAWTLAAHPDPEWARKVFADLWMSWQRSTPLGRRDVWHPYTASLRSWVLCGVHRVLVEGGDVESRYVPELAVHAGFVRANLEFDVGGNHLIKNLKALVGLGVFLSDGDLLAFARHHLARQLAIQVLPDGGHFERSPSYHCQVLGDLLDIRDLLRASSAAEVPGLASALKRMRAWLGAMLLPDGDVPLFNDCTLVGTDRIARLGPAAPPQQRVTLLEPSGYVVLRPSERIHLVADVGLPSPPELPAHAHADCLSFELAVDGQRVIVDSGTSTYQGERRAYERSTAAHNTVEVDGADQTEVWGTFRAARLARPTLEALTEEAGVVELRASHDGYRRLPGAPRHTRTWRCSGSTVAIVDEVTGAGRHRARMFLHFAPAMDLAQSNDGSVVVGPLVITMNATPPPQASILAAQVSGGFGRLDDAEALVVSAEAELPLRLEVALTLRPVSTIARDEPTEGGS